jgi:hypothetical protein
MRNSMGSGLRQWILMTCMICHAVPVQSADAPRPSQQQVREFDVYVDGSRLGTSQLKISDFADGRTVVATEAEVKVSYVVYTYKYQFRGTETWLKGRFRGLESRSEDGGKHHSVSMTTTKAGASLAVDGAAAENVAGVSLTTNFWYWPEALRTESEFALLESDNGKISNVTCELVGTDRFRMGEKMLSCRHYRIKGDTVTDLWFDDSYRFVCKKSVEEGHPTEIRLTSIQDIKPKEQKAAAARETTRRR